MKHDTWLRYCPFRHSHFLENAYLFAWMFRGPSTKAVYYRQQAANIKTRMDEIRFYEKLKPEVCR